MKLNLSGHRSTLVSSCLLAVVLLAGVAAFDGCGRVTDEELARAVETAMNQTMYRRKAAAAENLARTTDRLAVQQLERFNNAEKVYDTVTLHEPIPRNPYGYGFMYKVKRDFTSYEIVDMIESNSLLRAYDVFVRYNYDLLQTKDQPTATDGASERADKDFDFKSTGKEGAMKFVYRFDHDFNCLFEEGELIQVTGDRRDNYTLMQSPVATSSKVIRAQRRTVTRSR